MDSLSGVMLLLLPHTNYLQKLSLCLQTNISFDRILHLPLVGKCSMSKFLFLLFLPKSKYIPFKSEDCIFNFFLGGGGRGGNTPNLHCSQKDHKIKDDVQASLAQDKLGVKEGGETVVIYNRSAARTISVFHFCQVHPFWLEKSFLSFGLIIDMYS